MDSIKYDFNSFSNNNTISNNPQTNINLVNSKNSFDHENFKFFNEEINSKFNQKVETIDIDKKLSDKIEQTNKSNNDSIKVDGWIFKLNEDGTINKIMGNTSYIWSNRSLYKINNDGDIIIYDKDDENKVYMKLTKDGNIHELYSTEDYYKETVNDFIYQFNVLKGNNSSRINSSIDKDGNTILSLEYQINDKTYQITGKYNKEGVKHE